MQDELLGVLLGGGIPPIGDRETLAGALDRFVAAARRAWPELQGDVREFVAFVAPRIDAADPSGSLAALRPGDLWLAHRCACRDEAALRAFVQLVRPELAAVLRDPGTHRLDGADLEQLVLERLFAGTADRAPRIHEYGGRGPLGRWVYVVATRIRVDAERRKSGKEASLGAREDALVDQVDDPELGYLKQHYHDAFRRAFADAIAALGPRERTLLRLQVIHGRSATGIAEIYRVHRATAKRWLADIRAQLLADTRTRLQDMLAIDIGELDSIMRLIGSRLDASVRVHLTDAEPAPS